MKKYVFTIIYISALLGFTTYLALETFVIPHAEVVVSQSTADTNTDNNPTVIDLSDVNNSLLIAESDNTSELDAGNAGVSLQSDPISITLSTYREYDTTIYVADVYISSPEYLKTAFANGTYGRNIKAATSEIAESVDAILAINGDFYGSQETGYCIRNGCLYRSSADRDAQDLVIYSDGSFEIINESEITAEELLANGAQQVLSFGPALVENGEVVVNEDDEVGKAKTSNPRTAICYMGEGHYLFIVSDGRTDESEGLSLYQLALFAKSLGAQTVYNLDGGGSSTLYYNGEVINTPVSGKRNSSERSVSDIVYIGY
ncbi:MAG: phosphodiester glycosidase family protein [Lachnospiraceae bacterium]|nr:phosphodiester glycosidase family protein [Lachnospiraceae bacterium]